MVTVYRATNYEPDLQPIQVSKYSRSNVVADLALRIIKEEEKIPRTRLMQRLSGQYEVHGYAVRTLDDVLSHVLRTMEQQGLIVKSEETPEQYLTYGKLTYNQVKYVGYLLVASEIFESPRKKGKFGVYTLEYEAVFRKVGEYVDNGVALVEATRSAVKDVLGQEKAIQFYNWYRKDVEEVVAHAKGSRIEKRTEELREDPSRSLGQLDYDVFMTMHDCINSEVPLPIRSRTLDKLVQDFSKQHPTATKDYPLDLYFALSPDKPEAILRRKLNVLMQSAPTQARFADYEDTIFKSLVESLEPISARLIEHFDRGFEESEKQIKTLEEQIEGLGGPEKWHTILRVRGMKRGLETVKARYKDSGALRTLEEVGGERSKRQVIRNSESKGLELLRGQPTIQEILSLDFWQI